MSDQMSIDHVYLRSFSKIVFFYPLLILSFILWIIEFITASDIAWFGFLWIIMFFFNLFVISFDVSSSKFFILVLIISIITIIILFLIVPNVEISSNWISDANITMSTEFYLAVTIVLALVILLAFISAGIEYWKVERNEVYHKKGIFTSADRYPTKDLNLKKEIPDAFEFLLLGAGSVTLIFKGSLVFHIDTIPRINKRAKELDYLLSHMRVEIDNVDNM